MKLENIVMPLYVGLLATAFASGISKDLVESGKEAVTYIIAVPTGITGGYLLDKLDEYLMSKGYDFSGRVPKP